MRFARLDHRLFANHPFPVNHLEPAPLVMDSPVPGQQLYRRVAMVLDPDMIGPEPALAVDIRLLRQKGHRYPNGDSVRGLSEGKE